MKPTIFLAAVLLLPALLFAADYADLSTQRLLELRDTPHTAGERERLNDELNKRVPTMSEAQMERYMMGPQPSQQMNGQGMGDGRIATH